MSADDTGTTPQNITLSMSAVDIKLASKSRKIITSIQLFQNDKSLKKVQKRLRGGQAHQETFSPPLPLELSDRICASVRWGLFPCQRVNVNIKLNESYQEEIRNILISTQLHGAPPLKADLAVPEALDIHQSELSEPLSYGVIQTIEDCPRFRLLVIGNTGVGKSTLIQNVFGVKDVQTSENIRGEANIDREFISPMNERFVVHDSLGFEAGDEKYMNIMKEFVTRRQSMPVKDQIHAIWLCLEIPYAGGRLLETGVEVLLQQRKDILGNTPLVVVLTKVDLLDGYLEINLSGNETLESLRTQFMEEYCVKPLHKAAKSNMTHVAVSKEDEYTDTLLELLKATMQSMADDSEAPYALVAIAQRISMEKKIALSIDIAKKKYWNTLTMSTVFGGRTLRECLRVIQKDIVAIWNLNDPDECLLDDKFIDALIRTDDPESASMPPRTGATPTNSSGWISQKISDFLDATGFTDMNPRPMVNFVLFAPRRILKVYTGAQEDVETLMTCIIDLNCIMQFIFLFTEGYRVTRKTVDTALEVYVEPRKSVHAKVTDVAQRGVDPGGRDYALDWVEMLIKHYSIKDQQIRELKQKASQMVPQNLASGSSQAALY